jgi:ribosomal protein S18 acetylase RimI-like enzyme
LTHLFRDEFLAGVLGRPSLRVEVPAVGVDDALVAAIAAVQGAPVFLYAKLPTDAVGAVQRLERLGFHLIDTNVTLERSAAGNWGKPGPTRSARPSDRKAVMALAGRSFALSRLHLDPQVPRAAADRSRAEWAGNFFRGRRGDDMLIAEAGEDEVAGFLQLLGPREGVLTIDLIGVAPEHRRKGLAAALIGHAASGIPGARVLRVGTQVANTPSLRLYEGLGFRIRESHYVLHYHRI